MRHERITFITTEFYPYNAGVANAALAFAKALAAHNYDVHVITPLRKEIMDAPSYEEYEGLKIHRIYGRPFFRKPFIEKAYFLFFAIAALLTIRRINPDVVLGHMIWNTGSISALAGKLFGKISVTQVHGGDIDFAYKSYQIFLSRLSYKWNKIILATNQDFVDDLKKLGNKRKVHLLPNIVSEFKTTASKEDLKRELYLGDAFNVLCVGRLVIDNNMETKGIRYAIMAMKRLDNVCLHILGDGPLKTDYMEISERMGIKDKVIFHGKVPRDTLLQFMSAADAVILPSLREGLSMTMLEALSAGIPFIGTPIGGARDYIIDGENGFFIKTQDVDSIVGVVKKLQNNKELILKIAKNGYTTYRENFTGDAVVKKFEEIIQSEIAQ